MDTPHRNKNCKEALQYGVRARNLDLLPLACWSFPCPQIPSRYPSFDPHKEIFTSAFLWARLPYLPIQFWELESLQAIGNGLGEYFCASEETINCASSTCARICVEMDLSNGLPVKIVLQVGMRNWQQPVDYERIAFRCRLCFSTEHSTQQCPKTKTLAELSSPLAPAPISTKLNASQYSPLDLLQVPNSGVPQGDSKKNASADVSESVQVNMVSKLGDNSAATSTPLTVPELEGPNLKDANSLGSFEQNIEITSHSDQVWTEFKRKKLPTMKPTHQMSL
ncbi:hypothetical protein SUGI_0335280 [Cryptomeria japonica]|nr:hypothetical protein SUGI_0335280 [Cryptomeria japonica]